MSTDRRSFLARLGAGVTVAGVAGVGRVELANAQSAATSFTPAKHTQDDWMDRLPGKHRMVFDTVLPPHFGAALAYAGNFLNASKEYGLNDPDNAVIIIARHFATTFAFNDAMWAKYGKLLPPFAALDDPKTKARAAVNVFATRGYEPLDLPNLGVVIPDLVPRGVQFAVCNVATQFFAAQIAQATKSTPDAVYKELTSNLIGNSHMVPAGIVAVNRAQEHGFTLTTAI
jgi:intracellular sulfur oxidation DsrE/DsrF family protein